MCSRYAGSDSSHAFAPFLQLRGTVIVDGALATELEARGADLADPLWPAQVLLGQRRSLKDDRRLELDRCIQRDQCHSGIEAITSLPPASSTACRSDPAPASALVVTILVTGASTIVFTASRPVTGMVGASDTHAVNPPTRRPSPVRADGASRTHSFVIVHDAAINFGGRETVSDRPDRAPPLPHACHRILCLKPRHVGATSETPLASRRCNPGCGRSRANPTLRYPDTAHPPRFTFVPPRCPALVFSSLL